MSDDRIKRLRKQKQLNEELLGMAGTEEVGDIRKLLDRGAEVDARDEDQGTPLMRAAEGDNKKVARLLLERGADIHARDEEGKTALMHCCYGGNRKLTTLLLEAGAEIDARCREGQTALMYAAIYGGPDIIEILAEAGADLNATSSPSGDYLHLEKPSTEHVQSALNSGRKVLIGEPDVGGMTALMLAADHDEDRTVEALIKAGADVSRKNAAGETALSLATGEITRELLKQAGAWK